MDDDSGFGTRAKNSCLPEVAAARAEWADDPQPMSNFQCLAWEISAVWALPTIGTAIWAYYEPAALLDFGIFAAFQIWFVGRAVTGL